MKRLIVFISIASCFSVMLLSCASIITHKDTSEQTTEAYLTTPAISTVTTLATTPPWSTQTGKPIINSHSGHVMPNIQDKILKDQNGNSIISVKIISPKVVFYDNESLQSTVEMNLLTISNEIEAEVNAICNRYALADVNSFLSTPDVLVDFSLEYFTQEAMSLKFQITETDNNSCTYESFICYNIDLTTGSIINSTAVFSEKNLTAIAKLASEKLIASGHTLYSNSEKLIEQYFQNRWYIKSNKLSLCFNPGEIAAISEGMIEISVDLQQISDLLSSYGVALFTVSYENN